MGIVAPVLSLLGGGVAAVSECGVNRLGLAFGRE